MNKILLLVVAVLVVVGIVYLGSGDEVLEKSDMDFEIIPISHATAVLKWDGKVIYADPIGGEEAFKDQPKADFVFVTHEHGDHFHAETLEAILKADTEFIMPQAVADKLPEDFSFTPKIMKNGDSLEYEGFTITAVPAYNLREEALQFHPKGRDNGYIIERDGMRVYFSGDTEGTEEMRALENIDIAFVAMNLPYTMSVEDAAEAVLAFKPKKVYPYHYRTPDGFSDVEKFKKLVNEGDSEIEVVLARWYQEMVDKDSVKKEDDDKEKDAMKDDSSMKNDDVMKKEDDKKMEKKEVVFNVSGKNFEFNVEEIKVSKGDIVKINFTSESGFHDWVVDEFGASTKRVNDGGKTSVTFTADKAGTYEYYCSVGSHRAQGMVGKLIVK